MWSGCSDLEILFMSGVRFTCIWVGTQWAASILFVSIFNVMMLFTVIDYISQSRIKNSRVFQTISNITNKSKQSGLNFIRRVFIRRFDLWKISSGMHLEKIVSKHHSNTATIQKIMRARSNTERVR